MGFAELIRRRSAPLAFLVVALPAWSEPAIDSAALYREYKANPLQADAKYEGRRISVAGRAIKIDFADYGVGHIRTILVTGGPEGTVDSVFLCFAESCSSYRRPTVPDDLFKRVKLGSTVIATCLVQPVKWDQLTAPQRIDLQLTKCTLP